LIITVLTVIMGWQARKVGISYEFAQMLPAKDSTNILYQEFKEIFGEDGAVMFIGITDSSIFELDRFNSWYDLTYRIRSIKGVAEVLSIAKVYQLIKNDSLKQFEFQLIVQEKPGTQEELDSLKDLILGQPFYESLLYNRQSQATLMMVTLDKSELNTRARFQLIEQVKTAGDEFSTRNDVKVHYSGLPYIRTKTTEILQKEIIQFIIIALLIATFILFLFFRSVRAAASTMLIVIINVVWTLGVIVLLGYKITVLTGILPPLIVIIVVENCIFLLNKYHHEFRLHGNKIRALSRTVQRISSANLMTNATTAAGFATFMITGNKILVEFGIVASINIMFAYILSLFLVPIIFSFLPDLKERHHRHLDSGFVGGMILGIVNIVQRRRNLIYIVTVGIVLAGISGIALLKTTGRIVDDISHKDVLYKDLAFLEENFGGAMPFEISIDSRKKKGVMRLQTINKIAQFQDSLKAYPEFSRSLSIADVMKFSRQAFFSGESRYYELPNSQEVNFMFRYMPKTSGQKRTIINSFIDTNIQVTRISTQMANIGTREIKRIRDDLKPKLDQIFPPEDYTTHITGTSMVYLEGNRYMVKNLAQSLILAIILITGLMALLLSSFRMILVSMIPNLVPLVMTAGMMGFLNIPIKPSTILVFSIALGISVDNAIHFLSRYRLFLIQNNWNIKDAVLSALKETGYSMTYSSIVLVFGFSIFSTSSFGGTQALGYLITFTLLMALLCNLFLLPSLLLTLDKRITTRRFREPMVDIFDEELDIELEELELEKTSKPEET
jgi:hypothetical protein